MSKLLSPEEFVNLVIKIWPQAKNCRPIKEMYKHNMPAVTFSMFKTNFDITQSSIGKFSVWKHTVTLENNMTNKLN